MAVPVPRTYVAAEFETSTILNGDIRDTFNFLLAPPRAFAYRSAALTLTTGTWTLIGLDAEVYDPYATPAHDNTTNNSRMVAAETGLYQVNLKVRFNGGAGMTGNRFMELRKNAAGNQASGTLITTQVVTAVLTNSTTINETVEVQLNATDYLELFAEHTQGANLGLTTGSDSTFLQMRFATKQ